MLVPAVLSWEYSSNGKVPSNAVEAGVTADGEKLYYGRVTHDGCTTPGKVRTPKTMTAYNWTYYDQLVFVTSLASFKRNTF